MAVDPQTLIQDAECFTCYGVSLLQGVVLQEILIITNRTPATKYLVTSSNYAPVAGAQVTISAQLADVNGVPVQTAGSVVTWSKTGSDATFSSPTSVTNASGIATVGLTTDFANVAHIITATDNNGLTGNSAAVTSVVGPYTVTWAALVVSNGGVNPTSLEQASADRYYRNCLAAGLTTMIYSEILFISSSLIGACTPFLFSGSGGALWVNNSNRFLAGDLTINGLHGNGVDKYLTTVIVPSAALTNTSAGLVVYAYQTAVAGSGYAMGVSDIQNSNHFALFVLTASTNAYCWRFVNAGTDFISAAPTGRGFISMQRTAANLLKLYWANSTNAFSAVGTASGVQTGAATTTNGVWAFNADLTGGPATASDYTLSYSAITLGMTAAQAQAHYNAVQQLRTDIGGGFV